MTQAIFVGEEPSPTAIRMKVKWEDGRLAAKQLFDAFSANGFDHSDIRFINLFHNKRPLTSVLKMLESSKVPVVAMGNRVQKSLKQHGVNHIAMVHPAARGSIRKKENYAEHVKGIIEAISNC